jgi:GNAT superfamily N-acetyltransferase
MTFRRDAHLKPLARERGLPNELRVQRRGLGYNHGVIPGPVAIRSAQRDDLPAILRLHAGDELNQAQKRPFLTLSDAHYAALDAIAADPNNHVYVADVDGRVVGTFQLTFIRQLSYGGCLVAQVESVFVDPDQRSSGVGSAMMTFARAEAERRGAFRLQLTSNVKRERAHRFYERLGYQASHKGMKLNLGAGTK